MHTVEYKSALDLRQDEIPAELTASHTEKVRAVLTYLDTPDESQPRREDEPPRSRLFSYARRATNSDEDAEEIASQTKADLYDEEKHAKTYRLSGEVEDDAKVLRNWILQAIKFRASNLRRDRKREQSALDRLQQRNDRERPDYGSYRSANVTTTVTPEDGESDEPPTLLETDPQAPLLEIPRPEQDELEATATVAETITRQPQGTSKKKKGKPQPKEPTQPVKVYGGRSYHRQRESREIAKAQDKRTISSLMARWPHTYLVLLCHYGRGWLYVDRGADVKERQLRQVVIARYKDRYGLSKSTFSDRLAKTMKAMEAHAPAVGFPPDAPVWESATAKTLDKIEAEWKTQAYW